MKAQDVLTLGLFLAYPNEKTTYSKMAYRSGLSVGEVFNSQKRLADSGLIHSANRKPLPLAVREFLVHGLRYVFPPRFGFKSKGIVTLGGAPPMSSRLSGSIEETVWPYPFGTQLGQVLEPIHPAIPKACQADNSLYEWMVLFDCLRAGRAREKNIAAELVSGRLGLVP